MPLELEPAQDWPRVFGTCDSDGDGYLRRREIAACLRRGLQLITARQRIRALLDQEQHALLQRDMVRADANRDGGVDRAELAHDMGTGVHSAKMGALWRVSDANGDGVVDEKDVLTEEDVRSKYKELGINKAEVIGLRLYTGPM